MEKEIVKWNNTNPNNKVNSNEFNTFLDFQKMVFRLGVEQFVNNFPFADHRQSKEDAKITDEYIYDGIARVFIFQVENSGGKFKPQKFFKIKKMNK